MILIKISTIAIKITTLLISVAILLHHIRHIKVFLNLLIFAILILLIIFVAVFKTILCKVIDSYFVNSTVLIIIQKVITIFFGFFGKFLFQLAEISSLKEAICECNYCFFIQFFALWIFHIFAGIL